MPSAADSVRAYLLDLQSRIVAKMEALDGGAFARDEWKREEGGGGISRILEGGKLLEARGRGVTPMSQAQGFRHRPPMHRPQIAGKPWEAMGVSLVIHPRNPYVPTVHMNVRYFSAGDTWWFRRTSRPTIRSRKIACISIAPIALGSHRSRACIRDSRRPATSISSCSTGTNLRGIGGTFFDDFDEGGFE